VDDCFWWRASVVAFFCFSTHQLAQNTKDSQSLVFMPYQGKKISIMKESLLETKFKQVFRNFYFHSQR